MSVSGSLTYDAGMCGQAAVFDGNAKVTVHPFDGYAWGASFSVSVWFRCTNLTDIGYQGIVTNGYYVWGSWEILLNGGIANPFLRTDVTITENGGISKHVIFLYPTLTGTVADWNHAVMTFDGNQTNAYLNGVKQRTKDDCCNREIITGKTPVTIGQAGTGSTEKYFYGLIDEVRIYSYTLSESQVYDVYNKPCT